MGLNLSKAHFLSDVNKWFETEAYTCLCDVFFNIRFLGSKETKHAHNIQNDRGQGGVFLLHYSNTLLSILGCWIPFWDAYWWQYLHIGLMLGKPLLCFLRCLAGGISSCLPQAIIGGGSEKKSSVDLRTLGRMVSTAAVSTPTLNKENCAA